MPKRLCVIGLSSLLVAACSSSGTTNPPLPPCTASSGGHLTLAIAAYTAVDPTQTMGCAVFPSNAAGPTVEYLVVPQSGSTTPNDSEPFRLGGTLLAAPPMSRALLAPRSGSSAAQEFDLHLRRAERELAAQVPGPLRAPPPPRVVTASIPVDSGNVRTFKVCNVATCDPRKASTLSSVTATALKVGTHIAIYVDKAAPVPGLTQSDLDDLRAVFDTLLYETDTLAFGHESDIDQNGQVIVLMTGKVNSLVTASDCVNKGYIAGYFFGADLITSGQFSTGNNGEIFYSIVPDVVGTLSCAHSVSEVKQVVPSTFVHEFQHMISFNQHSLLRPGFPEDLWLNEGLSHYAEENAARRFLRTAPPDSATFCNYVYGDLHNAGDYLAAAQDHFLVDTAGIGGLAERGAYWLFVRYLVDQFATDTSAAAANAFTRRLVATTQIGAANAAAATGTPFRTLVEQWGLTNYVSDLPGFSPPTELQYVKWRFRSDFPNLRARCPNPRTGVPPNPNIPAAYTLVPPVLDGSSLQVQGVLRAGSGGYYRLQQAPGGGQFTLLFSNSTGIALRTSLAPMLSVIRIQ